VLFGTSPFTDLATIELGRNGLTSFRHAVFGTALGDKHVADVQARAVEMAEDILQLLKG
jgi:hypothetical protein